MHYPPKRKNGAGYACAVKIYTIPDCHRVSVLRARHVIEIIVIMVLAPFPKNWNYYNAVEINCQDSKI